MKKLNIGCGEDVLEGWDNCDSYPTIDSVIKSDILTLRGIKSNHYDFVAAHMVLEHVHVDLISTALHQISRVLKVGGKVEITVPDMDYFIDLYLEKAKNKLHTTAGMMAYKEVCYQLLDPELDENLITHQCLFNHSFLTYMLLQEGFTELTPEKRQAGVLCVTATKPEKISTYTGE